MGQFIMSPWREYGLPQKKRDTNNTSGETSSFFRDFPCLVGSLPPLCAPDEPVDTGPLTSEFFFPSLPSSDTTPVEPTLLSPRGGHSPSSSPPSIEEQTSFASSIKLFFHPTRTASFFCTLCNHTVHVTAEKSGRLSISCAHYQPCNECRFRVVRQILRCPHCCSDLGERFPVCDDECLSQCESQRDGLATSRCPRCNKKLCKEKCSPHCDRRTQSMYQDARVHLNGKVGILVLNPGLCLSAPHLYGKRPCAHFMICDVHQTIRKSRARAAECPGCADRSS